MTFYPVRTIQTYIRRKPLTFNDVLSCPNDTKCDDDVWSLLVIGQGVRLSRDRHVDNGRWDGASDGIPSKQRRNRSPRDPSSCFPMPHGCAPHPESPSWPHPLTYYTASAAHAQQPRAGDAAGAAREPWRSRI